MSLIKKTLFVLINIFNAIDIYLTCKLIILYGIEQELSGWIRWFFINNLIWLFVILKFSIVLLVSYRLYKRETKLATIAFYIALFVFLIIVVYNYLVILGLGGFK